ncbi:GGDEF domain-containing protein [Jatrophihabitans sp.]|uniref:GGDEF domain-containing protein n=1 Tax=Jatrophihabitans sp. TaxID=1932789 RepID=UPI0030C70C56
MRRPWAPPSGQAARALAEDEEQIAFWQRHTWTGVALCVLLPLIVVVHTALSSGSAAPQHAVALYALAAAVALPAPLLLLVPIARVVRHPHGRWFFDIWEGTGVALVATFALLDGGVHSPFVMFFYVLLPHAALSYPPLGMLIAGAGNIAGYLTVGLVAGDASPQHLLAGVLALAAATVVCAYASHNHVLVYRRTAAFARQLALLAERDGLTGCLNHRTFHARLQAEAVVTDTTHPLSLLIVDVDDFKSVNDTHGHPTGDEVLRLVGQSLVELSRAEDTAGRLGGDEFALLLPDTPLPRATAVAERLRVQVRERAARYGATVSVGIATTTQRSDTAGLLAAADRAVYRAKNAGRDRTAGPDDGPGPQEPHRAPPRAATSPS